MLEENQSLYDYLELTSEATPQQIRDAYHRVRATYQQDNVVFYSLLSSEERIETLRQIDQAYEILSDPQRRKDYDKKSSSGSLPMNNTNSKSISTSKPENDSATGAEILAFERPDSLELEGQDELLIAPRTDFEEISQNQFERPQHPTSSLHIPSSAAAAAVPIQPTPTIAQPVPPPRPTPPPKATETQKDQPTSSSPQKLSASLLADIQTETQWSGEFIQLIREASKVSLEEMSGITKVTKTYLMAIEQENFSKLPATVYVRGFLIQIAKVLRLPPDQLATAYLARVKLARKD